MFKELLARIAGHLASRGIPYMIVGGQAVLLYGEPRLTRDIDVTLGLGPERAGEMIAIARELGLRHLAEDPLQFARETFVIPCIDEASGIRVDFILSQSSYENEAIAKARPVKVNEVMVKFASLEDVLIHKVVAGRPRDLEDIRKMLVKNPSYDRDYVLSWLREFDQVLDAGFAETFASICGQTE